MGKLATTAMTILVASVGAIALFAPVQAQTAGDIDPLEDFQTNDSGSDIFGSNGTDSTSVFNMIHNLMLHNGTTLDQFNRQRYENIENEAASFREAQMQQIQQEPLSPDIERAPDMVPAE